jgi:hypothetical protein
VEYNKRARTMVRNRGGISGCYKRNTRPNCHAK